MARKSRIDVFKFVVLVCCFLTFCSVSPAADYYVSTTGDDIAGTGAITSPYRTIQNTLDNVVVSGDTIILRAGTYSENIRIRKSSITIQSMTGEWAVIQSVIDDEDKAIAVTFDVDSDGGILSRVEVIGGYWYGIKFNTKWDWGDPTDRSGACNIIIEDCKIHDTGNACIKVTPGCDDIIIRRCEIYNSGRTRADSAEAIDNVNGDRMVVQQCHIHDITATGLYAKGGANGVIIERCWVENCQGAGILVGFDTSPEFFDTTVNPDYYENIDGAVRNCVVMGTRYAGIGMYAAKNPVIYNNTLVDVAQDGHSGLYFGLTFQDWDPVAKRPSSVNPVIRNNVVVQSGSMNDTVVEIRYDDELGGMSGLSGMPVMSNNRYYVQGATASFEDNRPAYLFSGNLAQWQSHISSDTVSSEGDPQFVNAAGENYQLSFTSPCVDGGTANGAPNTDYNGTARPQGQGYDMGAYERVNSAEPKIQANGTGGQITVTPETPVAVTISLSSGNQAGVNAEWWIAAHTPLATPWNWAACVYGTGWQPGIHMYRQYPLSDLSPLTVLPSIRLPAGEYTFYFVLDSQINGTPDLTWMDSVMVKSTAAIGHVTYRLGDQIYRVKALEGATPENMSLALDALSLLPSGGRDDNLNISPDGKWLVLDTERFDEDCDGWACLAVVKGDLSSGDAVRVNGTEIHPNGFPAIASGGNLIVYEDNDGAHERDLWAVSRSSDAGAWVGPVLLTGSSSYQHNYQPAINAAGTKVLFDCTNAPYSEATNICEVGTDGTGFRVVLTPADSPAGLPDIGELHQPDYAPDGSIVFEADWDGEKIWRLPVGATTPVKVAPAFTNDNSPCVLPDGSIAGLWLNRPGGFGDHELKVMKSDGSSYYMLVTGVDVLDIGLGCGN